MNNVANSVQVGTIAAETEREAIRVVESHYPLEELDEAVALDLLPPVTREVAADETGHVAAFEIERLERALPDGPHVVELTVRVGDFVTVGNGIGLLRGPAGDRADSAVRATIRIASHHTLTQDEDFALRLLADIALRGLSPGVNDPTTAVTAILRSRAILEAIGRRWDPPRSRRLRDGEIVLVLAQRPFAELLEPLVEVGRYCRDPRPLEAVVDALASVSEAAGEAGREAHADDAARAARRVLTDARARIDERLLGPAEERMLRALVVRPVAAAR